MFFNVGKANEPRSQISISLQYLFRLPIALHLLLGTMTCAHCLSHEGSGPLTVGGPGSLNLLNLPLLRHCFFRRDRLARCRGGVATFVRSEYDAIEVAMEGYTRTLELL